MYFRLKIWKGQIGFVDHRISGIMLSGIKPLPIWQSRLLEENWLDILIWARYIAMEMMLSSGELPEMFG
jgi:hypothetical protein